MRRKCTQGDGARKSTVVEASILSVRDTGAYGTEVWDIGGHTAPVFSRNRVRES